MLTVKLTILIMLSAGEYIGLPIDRSYDDLSSCEGDALYRVGYIKHGLYANKHVDIQYVCNEVDYAKDNKTK